MAPTAVKQDQDNGAPARTRDAFHNGGFEVFQLSASGHRSGMDALLIAAALPPDADGILADMGSGAGVAGLAALNLNPNLDLLMLEQDAQLCELARETLLLSGNARFRVRTRIINTDVTLSGAEREKAGLENDSLDYAIMNPPYNTISDRSSNDPRKVEAHYMGSGGLDSWLRTAAAMLKPGGEVVLIYRTANLGDVIACCRGRFGNLRIMPIHSKPGEAAKRIIVRGTRASRAPLTLLPGFAIHKSDGAFTAPAEAIFDGSSHLNFELNNSQ